MRFYPSGGVAFNIRFLRIALVHLRILRVDIGSRQLHYGDGEDFGRCWISLGPLFLAMIHMLLTGKP
ncbi:hypothetical protein [Sodalis-like endosymbiont of Proechinophthirus fluctus]|uniref:hypothetical protein n=1 Tax=Sodalis-like endosymbiont of Proechinophthirus fluctus TaxID=1462730 RepID=UPI00082DC9E5